MVWPMRVTCERCRLEYELGDDRIPLGGAQVECTHCHHVFVVRHPPVADTVVLDRTERELLISLAADLVLLRQYPPVQALGEGNEPTAKHRIVASPPSPGLHEIANVRQVPGESPRRWFTSSDLDLIVWLGPGARPWGFQLCYGKRDGKERAVTWWPERGLTHSVVDEGRRDPLTVKGTPVLEASRPFDVAQVRERFEDARGELPAEFADFVTQRLSPSPRGGEGRGEG